MSQPPTLPAVLTSLEKQASAESVSDAYYSQIPDTDEVLKQLFARFAAVFLRDATSPHIETLQHCLRAIGYFVHHLELAAMFQPPQIHSLLTILADHIASTTNKTVLSLCVWIYAVQNLPKGDIVPQSHRMLETLKIAANNSFQSAAIEYEALNAAAKLSQQLGPQMSTVSHLWAAVVFPKLFSALQKNRDRADEVVRSAWPLITPPTDALSDWIAKFLDKRVQEQLVEYAAGALAATAIRNWARIVGTLGKNLHRGGLMNTLLPVPSKCFSHADMKVRQLAFKLWSVLVDNLAQCGKLDVKRVTLLVTPLVACMKHEQATLVREACMRTWAQLASHAHLVMEGARAALIDSIVAPALADTELPVIAATVGGLLRGLVVCPSLFVPEFVRLTRTLTTATPISHEVVQWLAQLLRQPAPDTVHILQAKPITSPTRPSTVASPVRSAAASAASAVSAAAVTGGALFSVLDRIRRAEWSALQWLVTVARDLGNAELCGALVEYLLQPGITHAALSSALVALLSKVAHDEQGIPLLAGFALRLREHDGVSGAEMLAKWRAIAERAAQLMSERGVLSSKPDIVSQDVSELVSILACPIRCLARVLGREGSSQQQSEAEQAGARVLEQTADVLHNVCVLIEPVVRLKKAATETEAELAKLLHSGIDQLDVEGIAAYAVLLKEIVATLHMESESLASILSRLVSLARERNNSSNSTDDAFAAVTASLSAVRTAVTCIPHNCSGDHFQTCIGTLVAGLVPLLRDVAQGGCSGTVAADVTQTWITVIQSVQRNAVSPLSSEWLTTLADALAVVFVAGPELVNPTMLFWEMMFSGAGTLSYPDKLVPVLKTLRSRTPIVLPGFPYTESAMPAGSQSQSQSQDDIALATTAAASTAPTSFSFATPLSVARTAPATAHSLPVASSLRVVPPSPAKSPLSAPGSAQSEPRGVKREASPPPTMPLSPFKRSVAMVVAAKKQQMQGATPTKRRLDYGIPEDDDSAAYVVVPAQAKGKQPLTEHQRETRNRKEQILTYTSLDPSQSQDMEYESQFSQSLLDRTGSGASRSGAQPAAGAAAAAPSSFSMNAFARTGSAGAAAAGAEVGRGHTLSPHLVPSAATGAPRPLSIAAAATAAVGSGSSHEIDVPSFVTPYPLARGGSDTSAGSVEGAAPATATTATTVTSPRGTLNSPSNGSQPSPVRPILKVNGSPSPGRKGTVRFAEAVDAVSPPPEFELTAEEKEQQQQQQQPREQQHQFTGPQSTPTLPLLRLPRAMEKEEDDGVPVCAALVDCTDPVDAVLSAYLRANKGLRQVLAVHYVSTVGRLAALTARQVRNLPLPGDPLALVLRVLHEYGVKLGLISDAPATATTAAATTTTTTAAVAATDSGQVDTVPAAPLAVTAGHSPPPLPEDPMDAEPSSDSVDSATVAAAAAAIASDVATTHSVTLPADEQSNDAMVMEATHADTPTTGAPAAVTFTTPQKQPQPAAPAAEEGEAPKLAKDAGVVTLLRTVSEDTLSGLGIEDLIEAQGCAAALTARLAELLRQRMTRS